MSTNTRQPLSDDEFEKELIELHHAALFDIEFQKQVIDEFKTLSPEAQQQLNDQDKPFIEDIALTDQDIDNILSQLPKKYDDLEEQTSPIPWWKKPFTNNSGSISLFDPRFSMGYTFAIGFGLAMLLQQQNDPFKSNTEDQFRSAGAAQQADHSTQSTSDLIPTETLSDPDKWMLAIIILLEKGRTEEAISQLKKFHNLYPDYRK